MSDLRTRLDTPLPRVRHATGGSTLADILERVLDAGVVLAGDVKIKIVDIELLTIQVRLVLASVDKAREIGLDWWMNEPAFCSAAKRRRPRRKVAPPASSARSAGPLPG